MFGKPHVLKELYFDLFIIFLSFKREKRGQNSPAPLVTWVFSNLLVCHLTSDPSWWQTMTWSSSNSRQQPLCWRSAGCRSWTCLPAPNSLTAASHRWEKRKVFHRHVSESENHSYSLFSSLQVVRYPDLHRLSLSMLTEITDSSLASVAWHCRSLSSLELIHCPGISDRGMAQAAPYLCRLQHLYLTCCNNITDRWVSYNNN